MFVLWRVHWEFPWRNVLSNCKIVKTEKDVDDKKNYYCLREQSFYISVFKTRKAFKRKGYNIPLKHRVSTVLARLLLKHIENKGDLEDPPLFCTRAGKPLTKSGYANLLTAATRKYLAKKVGSSLWRHIWLTHWSRNTPTLKQRRETAFRFHQTSIITQMRYVRPEAE